jgi:hypothetical protein
MENDDDSGLHDSPTEFLHAMASGEGKCYGQSILPVDSGDGFLCRCSCGRWLVSAPTMDEGLALARAHTATFDG